MNMLKLNIIALGVVGLGLASCADSFLDVEAETSIFDTNFYQTIDDFEMALVGCYDGYQRTSSNGNLAFYVTSEVLSDNCFGGTGNTDSRSYQLLDRFDLSQAPSENNLFNGTWSDYYAAIFRCNTLLQKMSGINWEGNEEKKKTIEGETRFLRAKLYFDLVRLFNRVPLILEPTTANVPQAEASETYKVIAEDLKFAAENISAEAYSSSWAAANDGMVTQWAAKSLLARVFLFYTGYYGTTDVEGVVDHNYVLAGLEDVIANGGYGLVDAYKNLWEAASSIPNEEENSLETTWAGRGNKEFVFTQKFNFTQDYNGNLDGNRWLVMMGMRNTNFSPYGKGWGACTVNPKLVAAFEVGDTRKTASVIDVAAEGIDDIFDKKDQREYTGYSNKKYTPMCLPDGTTAVEGLGDGDNQISQYQDFVVIRYADVLLMAAEMGSVNAQTYFDMVRARAGLESKAVSKDNIMAERQAEFAFEGLRYWDLLRQGLAFAATEIAESNVSVLSGNVEDFVNISSANITATKGFMQIPNTQITLSDGVLVQNEGWK
ncbi:RagB/SusD family nutrient uptake outer membrane protein [Saccharicrinis fermentans]|uniref:SusD family protein n=2 Tax=Saccharicrinis fermentans TaxID=982 RepID=W7Y6I0_9BACT|nr:RagB/SusD family nutrient uptake outer membrane protein [Saccharicrinis fermentans]GAF03817.1 SusD family protein [Saccharicrinis fermentans DSM 9555 = JCM 21142]